MKTDLERAKELYDVCQQNSKICTKDDMIISSFDIQTKSYRGKYRYKYPEITVYNSGFKYEFTMNDVREFYILEGSTKKYFHELLSLKQKYPDYEDSNMTNTELFISNLQKYLKDPNYRVTYNNGKITGVGVINNTDDTQNVAIVTGMGTAIFNLDKEKFVLTHFKVEKTSTVDIDKLLFA